MAKTIYIIPLATWISAHAALAQTTQTETWQGMCIRGDRTAHVTLVLEAKFGSEEVSGKLNTKTLTKLVYDPPTVSFDTPGVYEDQDIIRHFAGSVHDDGSIDGRLAQDDGKFATCNLAHRSGG